MIILVDCRVPLFFIRRASLDAQLTPLLCLPQQCEDKWGHLCALADFAIALNESIQEINKHSFNNFELRIGKSFVLLLPLVPDRTMLPLKSHPTE